MTKYIGILTAGGDSPGLNAAIRGVGKAAQQNYDMRIIGFRDGFPGLVENRTVSLVQAIKQRIANAEIAEDKKARKQAKKELRDLEAGFSDHTLLLARQLEKLTGLESRPSILGHLQRGGTPSAADRLLATRLGTACAGLINDGVSGIMVSARGESAVPVPLEEVAGNTKLVPADHPWVESARRVGVSLGD